MRPGRQVFPHLVPLFFAAIAIGCPVEKHGATPDTARVGVVSPPPLRDTSAVTKPVNDADVRMLLSLINGSEISAGATAARKGAVEDVRAFGRDMVADHTAMQQAVGGDTASRAGTSAAGRARADTLRTVSTRQSDSLSKLPRGAAFDRAYIDQQVGGHSMALDSIQRWAVEARTPGVDRLAAAALPKVRAHLDRARSIQASLGGMIRGPGGTGPDTTKKSRVGSDTSGH